MDALVRRESWGETSSRPIRARVTSASGVDTVIVEHLHYSCLADRAAILVRPATGMVLCECGSAGWLPQKVSVEVV